MLSDQIIEQLNQIVGRTDVLPGALMKDHTSFKIGGPADLLITPRTVEQVVAVQRLLRQRDIPLTWLGNGSNLLVSDAGIRGVVIKLAEQFSEIKVVEDRLVVAAGALLTTASQVAAENGLSGLEFACGIPGTIGGAAFMNAGAYEGDMSQVIAAVTVLEPSGAVVRLTADDLQFRYRGSSIQDKGQIVLQVELQLAPGDGVAIAEKIADLTARRNAKQPLELASAGSTFKRPTGYYAGKLIEDSGLRGVRFGDAAVSQKHCGFVVNLGEATCQEVITLITFIKKTVFDKFGVAMQTEVRMIGEGF